MGLRNIVFPSETAEVDEQMARFLATLTTRAPSDITSETSGFIDEQNLAESELDVQPRTDRPIYDITSSKILVIINNIIFSPGSQENVFKLYRGFTVLGFQIQVMQNLRASEMVEVLWRGKLT